MPVKNLASKPNDVKIVRTVDEMGVLYTVSVAQEDVPKIIGKEAALPLIASAKGLLPFTRKWPSLDDVSGMELGLFDNNERLTTADLPEFTAKLVNGEYVGRINGKEQLIDITKKPDREAQFNKPLVDEDGDANFSAPVIRNLKMKEDRN